MTMRFLDVPRLLMLISLYPNLNHALTVPAPDFLMNALNNSSDTFLNLTAGSDVHCTSHQTWQDPPFDDMKRYLPGCKEAARMARQDLWFDGHYELEEKYEFLDQDTMRRTTRPQIRLPKIYTASESSYQFEIIYA